MSKDEVTNTVALLARLFGIEHTLKTKVGDHKVQGVSGGERRRVSLAEALITCPE